MIVVICSIIEMNFRNYNFVIVYLRDTALSAKQDYIEISLKFGFLRQNSAKFGQM